MECYKRFLEYIKIDTMSDAKNSMQQPSSSGQFILANMLVKEMKEIGIENAHVDENCYVYGWIEASKGHENAASVGFIAHMDTSPAASGKNVKAVIHENYNGENLVLPNGRVINPDIFPELKKLKGDMLISGSGDTLLGADNKAGIAEILTMCDEIISEAKPHGKICIAFTPDEEIGAGANNFDVKKFNADYAYTVDGDEAGSIEYETFNAASADITINGVSVHPGTAKGIMENSIKIAMEFDDLLPEKERPEFTEEREGFFLLDEITGNVEKTVMNYIIRDLYKKMFKKNKTKINTAADAISQKYGDKAITIEIEDNYYNMAEIIKSNFYIVENARLAIKKAGLTPTSKPVRGGTDGSRLSFMGLPCPNLGTGGYYFHGPNEILSVEQMNKTVEILKNIVYIQAEQK